MSSLLTPPSNELGLQGMALCPRVTSSVSWLLPALLPFLFLLPSSEAAQALLLSLRHTRVSTAYYRLLLSCTFICVFPQSKQPIWR